MFECVCGFKGNSSHSKTCQEYHKEVQNLKKNIKKYIKNIYLENLSVSECCNIVKEREDTIISVAKIRKIIDEYLIDQNIKVDLSDKDFNRKRQEKTRNTMFERYGVVNNGQRQGQGWSTLNAIPYSKLDIDEELIEYRKKVEYNTRKYKEKLARNNQLPKTCFYTGITFKDCIQDKINPNDPYKRTIDHRIPVIEMFFKGYTAEENCAEENLVFCLRAVNTYKANTTEDYFVKEILPTLVKRL